MHSMYIVNFLCDSFCKAAKACLNIEIYEWKLQRHTWLNKERRHYAAYIYTHAFCIHYTGTYPVTTTTKSNTFHPFRRYESVCSINPRAIIFNPASRQNIANKYISASSYGIAVTITSVREWFTFDSPTSVTVATAERSWVQRKKRSQSLYLLVSGSDRTCRSRAAEY